MDDGVQICGEVVSVMHIIHAQRDAKFVWNKEVLKSVARVPVSKGGGVVALAESTGVDVGCPLGFVSD
jgi:hypothetical protein